MQKINKPQSQKEKDETSWEYGNWEVKAFNDVVWYFGHGEAVWGHTFGFQRKFNVGLKELTVCFSTYTDNREFIKTLEGKQILAKITVGEKYFYTPLTAVYITNFSKIVNDKEDTNPLCDIIYFNGKVFCDGVKFSFARSEEEDLAIKKDPNIMESIVFDCDKINLELLGPWELVKEFDFPTDYFSTDGYEEASKKAEEICFSSEHFDKEEYEQMVMELSLIRQKTKKETVKAFETADEFVKGPNNEQIKNKDVYDGFVTTDDKTGQRYIYYQGEWIEIKPMDVLEKE